MDVMSEVIQMNEYISKQRAKDLMGCCLASAKANYKEETDVFKRAKFQCYVETIEAMIDVVGAVETADVQPVKHGEWEKKSTVGVFRCSLCQHFFILDADEIDEYHFCPNCGARMDLKEGDAE